MEMMKISMKTKKKIPMTLKPLHSDEDEDEGQDDDDEDGDEEKDDRKDATEMLFCKIGKF